MANFSESSPRLVMVVEPETKIRFRYESEGGSHGGLPGKQKGKEKVYPTVKLEGYRGKKPIYIRVALYTEDYEEHVLEFKGTRESVPYIKERLQENNTAVFTNIKILNKKREEICSLLLDQKLRRMKGTISKAVRTQFENRDSKELKARAKKILNSVRLCFEAFEEGKQTRLCEPLFSEVISNQKAASKGELKIHRMSRVAGSWRGGDEVILLCDKVQKDNIKIEFYETDSSDRIIWKQEAIFSQADVHYQFAITFKTPPYRMNAEKTVFVCLARNDETSEPREFIYTSDFDENPFKKRKRCACETSINLPSPEEDSHVESSPGLNEDSTSNSNDITFTSESTQSEEDNSNLGAIVENPADYLTLNWNDFKEIFEDDYPLPFEDLPDSPDSTVDHEFSMISVQNNCLRGSTVMDLGSIEGSMNVLNITGVGCKTECKQHNQNLQIFDQKVMDKSDIKRQISDKLMKQFKFRSFLAKRNDSGNTFLHLAVLQNIDVTSLLKANKIAGVDIINVQNFHKETALHIAVKQNKPSVVEILLKHNSNPNIKNEEGNNCYHLAAENNFVDVMYNLLAFVNYEPEVDAYNYEGLSPFHIAIKKNSNQCYQLLKTYFPDLSPLDKKVGRSLLHYAVEFHPSLVEFLCDEKLLINSKDFEGNTPLHIASAIGNIEVVKQLLKAGADALVKNYKQDSKNEENSELCGQFPADLTNNAEILKILKASSSISVSNEMIERMCKLLDVQDRWKTVAIYFVDQKFIDSLQCSSSPAKVLLTHIKKENEETFIERLSNVLEISGLNDVLEVIKEKHI